MSSSDASTPRPWSSNRVGKSRLGFPVAQARLALRWGAEISPSPFTFSGKTRTIPSKLENKKTREMEKESTNNQENVAGLWLTEFPFLPFIFSKHKYQTFFFFFCCS